MARDFRPKGARDGSSKAPSKPKPGPQETPRTRPAAPAPAARFPAPQGKPKSHTTFDDDGQARRVEQPVRREPRGDGGPEPEPLFASFHRVRGRKGDGESMLVPPQASWMTAPLAPLPSHAKAQTLSDRDVDTLRARGQEALIKDNQAFFNVLQDSGRRKEAASLGALGTLSASDARFIADLLYGAGDSKSGGGGTLSDRISALTLLVQSSPLHNLETLDKLFAMVRKRSRHESGPAARAVVDWLASPGGLGGRKLHYFRDQPDLPLVASLASSEKKEEKRAVDQRLVVFAFEDELKKFYLHFLRALEAQTHDALPFVRIAALGHAYHLLRDQCEQEHNVLRLLVTKLGDPDRSVAAKVSSHLLGLLTAHPAMKPIVVREVAEEMQRARGTAGSDGKEPKANVHAQYYGVITLNQTVLTQKDTAVATALVALYFELFDSLMAQGGLEEPKPEDEEDAKKKEEEAKEKNRWRDNKGSKKGKKGAQGKERKVSALSVAEAHGRMLSALLAGMRRAFPFAAVPQDLLDKHVETLFKVTHTGSVTLAVQALQLLFQLVLAKAGTDKEKRRDAPVSVVLGPLTDRFYRTLYDSLLDTRLATSNKQAMYLNLLFKAIRADPEPNRAKAFVKRLSQVLSAGMDPSFICGALYLLSELVKHVPGLGAMLTDPEDGEPEHFVDARDSDDDDDGEAPAPASKLVAAPAHKGYDGKKRDPRYAGAETTCWWDILPLTQHFHPSVALCARQLVQGATVKSSGDLSLHTLTHFLDRFVYRNPKSKGEGMERVVPLRGGSAMQPSVASLRLGVSAGVGVVNLRRTGLLPSEDVRSQQFAQQSADQVAPDQAFFHRFVTNKAARQPQTAEKQKARADSDAEDSDIDSELGLNEEEVWKAMRRTLPQDMQQGAGPDEDDDDDAAMYDYSDDEDGTGGDDTAIAAGEPEGADTSGRASDDDESDEDEALEAGDISSVSDSDSDGDDIMEDEEDLLPFADFDAEEAKSQLAGTKRSAADEETTEGLSKSQLARRERKKRKNVPMFASVDNYAHMFESDDDGNMDD